MHTIAGSADQLGCNETPERRAIWLASVTLRKFQAIQSRVDRTRKCGPAKVVKKRTAPLRNWPFAGGYLPRKTAQAEFAKCLSLHARPTVGSTTEKMYIEVAGSWSHSFQTVVPVCPIDCSINAMLLALQRQQRVGRHRRQCCLVSTHGDDAVARRRALSE